MRDNTDSAGDYKPAIITDADAAELVRAKGARSHQRFKQLLAHHRSRGITDAQIASAMARSQCLANPIGPGRPRDGITRNIPITRITIKAP